MSRSQSAGQLRGQKRHFQREEAAPAEARDPLENLLTAQDFGTRHVEPVTVRERHLPRAD
jgi:GH25 family lysozyme M1 (1,4-beta-N-acetylmuramidase)